MTRAELKKHWDVIKAYKEGKEIQYLNDNNVWKDVDNPGFFTHYEYRIKPGLEYVPFDFSDAEYLIGKVVVPKDKKNITMILAVNNGLILTGYTWRDYKTLFDDYTFLDGSICGKIKE